MRTSPPKRPSPPRRRPRRPPPARVFRPFRRGLRKNNFADEIRPAAADKEKSRPVLAACVLPQPATAGSGAAEPNGLGVTVYAEPLAHRPQGRPQGPRE